MDLKTRAKNPHFWGALIIAVCSPVLAYFGLSTSDFTTWGIVFDTFIKAISNPYIFGLMLVGAWSVIYDPTSAGWLDG